MVYRGKPSLGCKKCRQRKIKCDERPGGCAKCEDKGHVCPGYDNPLDRFFQDESAAVKVKADRAKAKAIQARDERDRTRAKSTNTNTSCVVRNPLQFPLLDQGIAYFMTHYAVGLETPPAHSDEFVQHLNTFGFHPLIATSMTALGLAGIGNLTQDATLQREATRWYTKALRLTNKALASPSEVTADTTLFATLLLSVFETTSNDHSLLGWVSHVEGSASLLRMRGAAQFRTPAGRRMFKQTVGMLTIKCVGGGEPVPDFVHRLVAEVAKWDDGDDPGTRFYHMHIAVCELRAAILSAKLTSLHEIVARARAIDDQARGVFDAAGEDFAVHVQPCARGTPGVFGEYYHVYPSLAAAQTWNWVYYNRIFLLDIIRNALIAGLGATPPVFVGEEWVDLLGSTTQELYKMQGDILASMPQHMHDAPKVPPHQGIRVDERGRVDLGAEPRKSESPPSPASTATDSTSSSSTTGGSNASGSTPGRRLFSSNFLTPQPSPARSASPSPHPSAPMAQLPLLRVSGGFSSLFALYIAGATPIASPESQAYVLHTLERVAEEFGVKQAKVLAGALAAKIKMEGSGLRCGLEGAVGADLGLKGYRNGSEEGSARVVPVYLPTVGTHLDP